MKLVKDKESSSKIQIVTKKIVEEKRDWWEELSENQKILLEKSLLQAEKGEVHDYKEFIKAYL